jgi:alpha-D-ribose 1-methylphosphonate 5-triphosphate synthase subunit PhnG
MSVHASTVAADPAARQAWLGTLALAEPGDLARAADPVLAEYAFETLRAPEVGLMLLRARIGGDGDRFNLGEATVARCVLRHTAPDGQVSVGVGHVLGRDGERVRRIAALDALLQRPVLQAAIQEAVVQPLARAIAAREQQQRAQTEATRVDFFTLQAVNPA